MMMYFEDKKKLYKAIEVARQESEQKIIVQFTYYDLDGTQNESRSRYYTKIFSTVLNEYEYVKALSEEHFLKNITMQNANETDTTEVDIIKLNFPIYEAALICKGFRRSKIIIGRNLTMMLDVNRDEFMQEARTIKKDFEEYEREKNNIRNCEHSTDLDR